MSKQVVTVGDLQTVLLEIVEAQYGHPRTVHDLLPNHQRMKLREAIKKTLPIGASFSEEFNPAHFEVRAS